MNEQQLAIKKWNEIRKSPVIRMAANENPEASQLMLAANDFFGFLNTIDAPPKENFN